MKKAKTFSDTHAGLSRAVMNYLGKHKPKRMVAESKQDIREDSTVNRNDQLFSWVREGSDSDNTPAPKTHSEHVPKLRVSPLLSKQAAEGDSFMLKPIHEAVQSYRDTVKSPIVTSLLIGSVPALGYYLFDKFTNPDSVGSNKAIEQRAQQLIDEDIDKGIRPSDASEYIQRAIGEHKSRRNRNTLWALLAAAGIAHLGQINPKDWSQLYKYSSAVRKSAGMLGPSPAVDFGTIRSAVEFNDKMSPSLKHSALNALSFNPKPMMTSTDIVNNAIYSGESAKTGLPIGRLISSAVVDAAAGYGIGKWMGLAQPGRLAGLFGAGSALINAISYNNNNISNNF